MKTFLIIITKFLNKLNWSEADPQMQSGRRIQRLIKMELSPKYMPQ
jgi:hypothetical protein